MSEATDFHPQPRPVAPPRRAQAAARSRDAERIPQRGKRERIRPSAWEDPEEDPRLEAALSLRNPVYPLDPPIVDVRIPVREPHAAATAYSRSALRYEFPDAQVGDDLHMLFTEPGKKELTRLSPDILVALNVRREDDRGDYDADVLGPPDFVLEVVSRSTWRHDVGRKLRCYQQIGVRECLFFDATGEDRAGEGELWGYTLTPAHAEPLAAAREGPAPCMKEPLKEVVLPNGKRGVRSEVLGLVAYVAGRTPPSAPDRTARLTMRWHNPATGADIPDFDQSRAQTRAEKDRADAAEHEARAQQDRADAAEHEAQALRRQIAELEERLRRRDES